MAIEHLDTFRDALPEMFRDLPVSDGFENDFVSIGVDSIESTALGIDLDEALVASMFAPELAVTPQEWRVEGLDFDMPDFGNARFPGAPVQANVPFSTARRKGGPVAPPDSLAFYLPYHYYHPHWWGVYLTLTGIIYLSEVFQRYECDPHMATKAARYFLYYHEYFHHRVESFATRVELITGRPAYRTGIEQRYQAVAGTDEWLEEALANAYAYGQVRDHFRRNNAGWKVLDQAIREYIDESPPGFRMAREYLSDEKLGRGEDTLSEDYLHHVLGNPIRTSSIWRMFPHAFSGIMNRLSRVNYVISRGSTLLDRIPLQGRLL